jgi:predicted secreted protein
MTKTFNLMAMGALLACVSGAFAQNSPYPPPQNVVQLSASGQVEVAQDLLSMTLRTTKEGADAAAVQTQLKTALDAALAEARRQAAPGQMDVRTGSFGIYPRYGKDSRITGWRGTAELVLEGKDFPRITSTAARITTLVPGNVDFGLSREQQARVEGQARTQAIEQFKTRAGELAQSFGFTGYTLREVSVDSSSQSPGPRPRMMAMKAESAADMAEAPVPVEAGKSTVVVNVSGSVQLR